MTKIQSSGGAKIVPPIPVKGQEQPLRSVTPARDWLLQSLKRVPPDAAATRLALLLYNALAPFGALPDAEIPADLHRDLADFAALQK